MRVYQALLGRIRAGGEIAERAVVVTAHPDDETVGMGGTLAALTGASILQLTDGAIDDQTAWTGAGVASREAYRDLRLAERTAAFEAAGWTHPIIDCDVIDQETVHHLQGLLARVRDVIAGAAFVWTHPYEGGHVDHDSAAFLVQTACERMYPAPLRIEFASYHWNGARRVAGEFWPPTPVAHIAIHGHRLERKRRALAAYRSQQSVLRWFPPGSERFRLSPRYDFRQPPPTPGVWYDRRAWRVTNQEWRHAAAQVDV